MSDEREIETGMHTTVFPQGGVIEIPGVGPIGRIPPGGSFSIGGTPGAEILSRLDEDEKHGAVAENYRRGNFCVHINLYKIGHLREKHELPSNRIARWFLLRSLRVGLGPYSWSYQVNFGGALMGCSARTRAKAIAECKAWIDEQIEERERRA